MNHALSLGFKYWDSTVVVLQCSYYLVRYLLNFGVPQGFFYQNGLHTLLTKQFYKKNCEIIKKTINREQTFDKMMTKIYKTILSSSGY